MATAAAVMLALAIGYNGPNGLDPDQFHALATLDGWVAGDGDPRRIFTKWIEHGDAETRAKRRAIARALVGCALLPGTTVRYKDERWEGELGLAPSLARQMPLELERWRGEYDAWAAGQRDAEPPTLAKPPPTPPRVRFWVPRTEGQWVSACLMAHANVAGSHEYISLRGNPPGAKAAERLHPSDAERWTMGLPEGVFLADLFHDRLHERRDADRDLKKSMTFSLNLPDQYTPGPSAGWWPPNARVGRSLDYLDRSYGHGNRKHLIATRLGRYMNAQCTTAPSTGGASQPSPSDLDPAVKCETPAGPLPVLFVYGPTLVNFESFPKPDPASLISVRDVTPQGTSGLNDGQIARTGDGPWVGPFPPAKPGKEPDPPPPGFDGTPARLVGLLPKQAIEVELRAPVALGAPKYPAIPDGTDFTAIVRYVSRQAGVAKVEVSSARDSWTEIGHDWPQTDEPQWLQIWPVPLEHGTRSLRIRITAEGGTAPLQLDAAGFVPGRPWCLEQSTPPPFMGICTGTYVVRSVRH